MSEALLDQPNKPIILNGWFNHQGKVFPPGQHMVTARQHKDLTASMARKNESDRKKKETIDKRMNLYLGNLRQNHAPQQVVQVGMSPEDVAAMIKQAVAAERAAWDAEKNADLISPTPTPEIETETGPKKSLNVQKT